ncbi:MAG: DUF1461 domain-containing protein [Clostridia bacterium]|nr:DUF1461 domain-containing protein [Clostridia bacterium]
MNKSMLRRSALRGGAAVLALIVFGVTGIILCLAGDGSGMEDGLRRFAPPEKTGLPETEYAAAAALITGYLTDRTERFQMELAGNGGETVSAFHDYEAEHMADCRGLIRLDRLLCGISLVLAVGLLAREAAVFRKEGDAGRKAFSAGALRSIRVTAGVVLALAVWACADFDGLFVTFHRVAFRNDLWLLNPRTDLLIRLMPEQLFVRMGIRGGIAAAVWVLLLYIAAEALKGKKK